MNETEVRLQQLLLKVNALSQRYKNLPGDLDAIHREINALKESLNRQPVTEPEPMPVEPAPVILPEKPVAELSPVSLQSTEPPQFHQPIQNHETEKEEQAAPAKNFMNELSEQFSSNMEKFIGENLINKIGIIITIIGVSIGVKYSIEHDLISPLARILLSYTVAAGLLFFGIKLKAKYENYSAVLVSGAIALMYFITYGAYSFYNFIPQIPAFLLMVVFTVFAVIAALQYNNQVIAHIGLVGAYAIPFLLSNGSGRVAILFAYMVLINIGILFIAFKRYWKPLYYVSFGLSWLIFSFWITKEYSPTQFTIAILFLSLFFITFYLMFLSYKFIRKEQFSAEDVVLLLSNSFVFYALGYSILSSHDIWVYFTGLFTLINSIIHCSVAVILYRKKLADKNLLYLIIGLSVVYLTLFIPVQFDGNWVTLLWAGEATVLFTVSRKNDVTFYERISYPLMLLSFISFLIDCVSNYGAYNPSLSETRLTLFLNVHFFSSVLFSAAFAWINFLRHQKPGTGIAYKELNEFVSFALPAIFIIAAYLTFGLEIYSYWQQLYTASQFTTPADGILLNTDLKLFQSIWMINYSLLFFSALSMLDLFKFKSKNFGYFNFSINMITLLLFLCVTLYQLSELRESYLGENPLHHYPAGVYHIIVRYISLACFAVNFYCMRQYVRSGLVNNKEFDVFKVYDIVQYTIIIWVLSSELISWIDLAGFANSYKLGLSILWGVYALVLVFSGIRKNKKHVRISAIVLFAFTLIKLFVYDISSLGTGPKIIVFVTLGILLLVISFLYNKYKNEISNPDQTVPPGD